MYGLGNADSEGEYSISPSLSAWMAQMKQASQECKHNNNADMDNNGFAFAVINQRKEIISDHSYSEMVSEYVDTEVSEEEIVEKRIRCEVEVEESESGYTLVSSPLHPIHRTRKRNQNQRHSVLIPKRKNTKQNNEIRSPNAENRPLLHTPNQSKNGLLFNNTKKSANNNKVLRNKKMPYFSGIGTGSSQIHAIIDDLTECMTKIKHRFPSPAPYIDDNQINDDPPLPSSNRRNQRATPKNKNSDKQEQDDEDNDNERLVSVARSNQATRYSNLSHRSVISRSHIIVSGGDKQTQLMNGNNMSEDECGTFDKPQTNVNARILREIRSKSDKPRPKGKMTKSLKSKNRKPSTQSESECDMNDMSAMMDIDSPNVNENCDEKVDIENERSNDDIHTKGHSDHGHGSVRNEIIARSKYKTQKKKKKHSGKEEVSTKKKKLKKKKKTAKKKLKKSRKCKSSESYTHNPKRPRLSQYMERPNEAKLGKVADGGLRRSQRVKFRPLAFWANQRIEYTPNVLTYDTLGIKGETVIAGQNDVLNTWQSKVKTHGVQRKKKAKKKRRKHK